MNCDHYNKNNLTDSPFQCYDNHSRYLCKKCGMIVAISNETGFIMLDDPNKFKNRPIDTTKCSKCHVDKDNHTYMLHEFS